MNDFDADKQANNKMKWLPIIIWILFMVGGLLLSIWLLCNPAGWWV